MHVVRRVLAMLLLMVPAIPGAQQGDLSGVAFIDANGNGVRDTGERGLANVVVSNQDAVVATDSSGVYRLPRRADGVMFVSVPDGYRTVGPFWRPVDDTTSTVDLPLSPIPPATGFTFIHASDPHLAPAVLARTQRFRALADSLNPAFVIMTGDLVRDALRVGETEATGYYELFMREAALFKCPLWTVPGNHENFGIERDKSHVSTAHPLYGRKMYRHYRGPDYYSFNFGGVHFVGLNTVDIDDQWYYGHVDSLQLAWLERDLAMVPATVPVVTFDHIPFFSSFEALSGYTDEPPAPTLITVDGKTAFRHTVSNAGAVLAVLRTHLHVLALGGHIHAGEQIVYDVDGLKTRFHQTPAIVGANAGAGMRFVSGFTLYTVRNGVIDDGRFIDLGIDKEQ
jgi:calcineurin-like phosphoesterase family protein